MALPTSVGNGGDVANDVLGMVRDHPDQEDTLLQEEFLYHEEGTRKLMRDNM